VAENKKDEFYSAKREAKNFPQGIGGGKILIKVDFLLSSFFIL